MALLKLLGLCVSMFLGAFVCGEIPLRCTMNQRHMKYVTTVGVGLLIGVSFIVIIPEGVHTYYGAKPPPLAMHTADGHNSTTAGDAHDHEHEHRRRSLLELQQLKGSDGEDGVGTTAVRLPSVSLSFAREDVAPPSAADIAAEQSRHAEAALLQPDVEAAQEEHEHEHERGAVSAAEHDHDHTDATHSHAHSSGEEDAEEEEGHAHGHAHSHEECVDLNRSSANVGAALVLGFVVMFLVDRIGGGGHEHAHGHGGGGGGGAIQLASMPHTHHRQPTTSHIHVHPTSGPSTVPRQSSGGNTVAAGGGGSTLSAGERANSSSGNTLSAAGNHEHARSSGHNGSSDDDEKKQLLGRSPHLRISPPTSPLQFDDLELDPLPPPHFDQTATIGILVHSAIDGLALGAIAVSDNSSLELVVFFAIILHKAPAAFGLTSFLLHQGRERSEVRKHLLYFSLAAPVTSLVTFVSFYYYNQLAGSSSLSASSPDGQALLGLCLLFSAGTFLFTIAVHILPEIQPAQHSRQQCSMLLCLIVGILAPLLFSSHNHGH